MKRIIRSRKTKALDGVALMFVIDKQGRMVDFTISEGVTLSKRTITRLGALKSWKPAMFKGKTVKTWTGMGISMN